MRRAKEKKETLNKGCFEYTNTNGKSAKRPCGTFTQSGSAFKLSHAKNYAASSMANRKCNANRGEKLQRKHCWISLIQRCCLLYPSLPRGKTMNIIFTLVVLQGGWLKVSCKTPGGRGMVKAKIFLPFTQSVRWWTTWNLAWRLAMILMSLWNAYAARILITLVWFVCSVKKNS